MLLQFRSCKWYFHCDQISAVQSRRLRAVQPLRAGRRFVLGMLRGICHSRSNCIHFSLSQQILDEGRAAKDISPILDLNQTIHELGLFVDQGYHEMDAEVGH